MSNSPQQPTSSETGHTGDERFARRLRAGDFFLLVEVQPLLPADGQLAERQKQLLRSCATEERVFAMVVTDRVAGEETPGPLALAEDAAAITAKPVVCVVSGKGVDSDHLAAQVSNIRKLGLRDFLAVTGDLSDKHLEMAANAEAPAATFRYDYTDSLDSLRLIGGLGADNMAGAVVNPFKYLPEDLLWQYAKMVRKCQAGARFIVCQAGWDMAKYQELVWYARAREMLVPLVARVAVIGQQAEEGKVGTELPLFLSATYARKDCERRKALELAARMAVGCSHLGYSGVLFQGVKDAEELHYLLDTFQAICGALPNWSAWAQDWRDRFQGVSFVPFVENYSRKPPFYLYRALMDPAVRDYSFHAARPVQPRIPGPRLVDRLSEWLSREGTPQWLRLSLGKWLRGGREEGQLCHGLDNYPCPKHLCSGPCGGSHADGTCEAGKVPCFFQRVWRLAASQGQLEQLERESQSENSR
ncbi:MAG: methylenetetrahydrofolate reductase C-terminal domain-containing protein [Victivallales bacterium]|nr:methylenetetrahydrofolate reductase C-terminal domain-containing protein [Victivallales bacterium]